MRHESHKDKLGQTFAIPSRTLGGDVKWIVAAVGPASPPSCLRRGGGVPQGDGHRRHLRPSPFLFCPPVRSRPLSLQPRGTALGSRRRRRSSELGRMVGYALGGRGSGGAPARPGTWVRRGRRSSGALDEVCAGVVRSCLLFPRGVGAQRPRMANKKSVRTFLLIAWCLGLSTPLAANVGKTVLGGAWRGGRLA